MSFDPNYNEKPDKRRGFCTDWKNREKWRLSGVTGQFQWLDKCQVCGRIVKEGDVGDVEEQVRNSIVEDQKKVRCGPCVSWIRKGYLIRAGWEDYLAQSR